MHQLSQSNVPPLLKEIQKHNKKINSILIKLGDKEPSISQETELALYSCLKIEKALKKIIVNTHNQISFNQNFRRADLPTNVLGQQNVESLFPGNQDQMFANAINICQSFKVATSKLTKKVGILLQQQQSAHLSTRTINYKKKHNQQQLLNQQQRQSTQLRKQLPHSSENQHSSYTRNSPHWGQQSAKNQNQKQKLHKQHRQPRKNNIKIKNSQQQQQSIVEQASQSEYDDRYNQESYNDQGQMYEEDRQSPQSSKHISQIDQEIMQITSILKRKFKQ